MDAIKYAIAQTLSVLFVIATHLEGADVDYMRDIRPLLRERRYACHGALKQESGLRLDTGKPIRTGSDSGLIVSSGNPDESTLLERITSGHDISMLRWSRAFMTLDATARCRRTRNCWIG